MRGSSSFLFPLTEWVPEWLDFAFVLRAMPWLGSWRPGDGARVETLTLAGIHEQAALTAACCR